MPFAQMAEKLEQFKTQLEEFASKHKGQIAKDPVFRSQFNHMCRTIGVDPLQCKGLADLGSSCA